ncbi:PREDICTED: leucine-rich repeat protein soc-2-like [Amphimedon queenslandica]|uniref:Leucine-rich repeat and death domain-containing protein 1 n=1 Tax=Amphimedon queenslandica TaxID=400682 RepID=A0A1X7VMT8_AMPQE|nr:PREDICTED: leucine-rich repeat protein soc-2-like [Amphimedon queenslandica]|eukprot:XP_011409980.1 PREDICTED: leucine-rich repeat protein soc-2-like [Amphimedon queenslandica]
MAQVPVQQQQQQPGQPRGGGVQLPPLVPNTLDDHGLMDSSWFKVVITKCPSGDHIGTASVSLDRWNGAWDKLPEEAFMTSAMLATSLVPIRDLILRGHHLSSLPSNMASEDNHLTSSLVVFDISSNRFVDFPPVVCQFLSLRELNASSNKLCLVPQDISYLTNLQALNLNNNSFQSIPVSICLACSLQSLSMESNRISKVPEEIGRMTNLQELYLKSNKISKLPESFSRLQRLQTLHISDNSLVALPQTIGDMVSLKQLHAAQNKLTSLPASIGRAPSLQGLTVANNPLIQPPQHVCRGGLSAIKAHLKTSYSPKDKKNRSKDTYGSYETDV